MCGGVVIGSLVSELESKEMAGGKVNRATRNAVRTFLPLLKISDIHLSSPAFPFGISPILYLEILI
jgi:hypothetical protein